MHIGRYQKMGDNKAGKSLHIAMYPWFAFGHFTPFLNLANKLAQLGHRIPFFIPPKALHKLASHNHHPNLITFLTITFPAVDGLPPGVETTADAPSVQPLLMAAMDLTRPMIESFLASLKPDFIFFDFTHWLPDLARKYQVKPIHFSIVFMPFWACLNPKARQINVACPVTDAELMHAPPGFPCPSLRLPAHDARRLAAVSRTEFGLDGLSLIEKAWVDIQESDAICCKGCREMDGPYGDYFYQHYKNPVLWTGLELPTPCMSGLDNILDRWLKGFKQGEVVYCALGSECVLEKDQFQELLLGLDLTGLPFMAVLKPPMDYQTLESAVPQGFIERTRERGIVQRDWVQQELILKHPSVGCFVTHCGAGSLSEVLANECQLVLLPMNGDQFINAKLMGAELQVGVEVKRRDEDGYFTREAICEAIMTMMEPTSEVGIEARGNHAKWREFLLTEGLQESYVKSMVQNLHDLLD